MSRTHRKKGQIDPSAMTAAELAALLSAADGRAVTEETIRRHLDSGAPAGPDGRLNLIEYTAWLVQQTSGRGVPNPKRSGLGPREK